MKIKRRRRRAVLLTLFLVIVTNIFGQNIKITGKVFDADATTPLIGVTIIQKGEKSGTITDLG